MGMYSYFKDEDIEIIDAEGLKAFMELWEREGLNELNMYDDDEKFTFQNWDDIKLISYWYEWQQLFFKCVAKFIVGQVTWTFENDDEGGWVQFERGKCYIHSGVMQWNKSEPKIDIKDEKHRKIATLMELI